MGEKNVRVVLAINGITYEVHSNEKLLAFQFVMSADDRYFPGGENHFGLFTAGEAIRRPECSREMV